MKILLFILLAYTLHAEILQVKQLFNYKTVTVEKKEVSSARVYYGKTVVDESRVRDISLRFDAFVTKLFGDESYKYIKKGDPLFRLYSKEVVSLLEELALSRNISGNAAANARRKLKLLGLEELTGAEKSTGTFLYPSPSEGYIISKTVNEGSFAKRGKRLMQIVDFSSLWVIADIYQRDMGDIRPGQLAEIKVEGFPPVEGRVAFLYPKVDIASQTVPVKIVLSENKRLFPGLFAKVKLFSEKKTQLILPKTAVLQKGEKQYVFIPEGEGTFTPREITAKRFDSHTFSILSGLEEGERVVDKALFLLDSDALTNGLYETEEDDDW